MPIEILNSKEKKEIIEKLKSQFGVDKLNGELMKIGKERLFFYSNRALGSLFCKGSE